MNYTDRLRCLAINDTRCVEGVGGEVESGELDPKTLALVRLAALVAVGGAVASYGAEADAAVSAGATAPRSSTCWSASFPSSACPALSRRPRVWRWRSGYDVEEALEHRPGRDVGYPPSRPTAVACCTAPLREETPSFR